MIERLKAHVGDARRNGHAGQSATVGKRGDLNEDHPGWNRVRTLLATRKLNQRGHGLVEQYPVHVEIDRICGIHLNRRQAGTGVKSKDPDAGNTAGYDHSF